MCAPGREVDTENHTGISVSHAGEGVKVVISVEGGFLSRAGDSPACKTGPKVDTKQIIDILPSACPSCIRY